MTLAEWMIVGVLVIGLGGSALSEWWDRRVRRRATVADVQVPAERRRISIFCDADSQFYDEHRSCDGHVNYPYGLSFPCECECHT